jgi:hypothetical protein
MKNDYTKETVDACQACEKLTRVWPIEDDDPVEPYFLCQDCSKRLSLRALRPLEWFNLASKHGWQKYSLHDDFYDEDGTATQPDVQHFSDDGMLAPSLNEAATSLERLLGYCFTRWSLGDAEFEALAAYNSEGLLAKLNHPDATSNPEKLSVALTICANVLGVHASTWVSNQYERSVEEDLLYFWADAAAICLPPPEGLEKTINALTDYKGRQLNERIGALSWFRSDRVLVWIEGNAPSANVTGHWGQLAALSNLTWNKAEGWLARGRPFSLIALDALDQFMHLPRHAPLVRKLKPALRGVGDRETVLRALETQKSKDPSPRCVRKCDFLVENIEKIHIAE